jgi:hypothetical protein
VGNDQRIYDAQGNPTGYALKTLTYISGPAGDFSIDEYGNVGGDIPFDDLASGNDLVDRPSRSARFVR